MNVVTLVGPLPRDPELTYTSEGLAVCNFAVETQETRDKKVTVQHVPVVAFGDLAENISENARRGSLIEVTGKANVRQRQSKDGSRTFADVSIVAGKAAVLTGGASSKPARMTVDDQELTDLPF